MRKEGIIDVYKPPVNYEESPFRVHAAFTFTLVLRMVLIILKVTKQSYDFGERIQSLKFPILLICVIVIYKPYVNPA